MNRLLASAVIAVLAMTLVTSLSAGVVPTMMNYQGRLTNAVGVIINDTVTIRFSIYADSIGGIPLWTETHPGVGVRLGLFTVRLGESLPLTDTVFKSDRRWLEIQARTDGAMTPRTPFVSVAYAFRATYADSAKFIPQADTVWRVSNGNAYRVSGNIGIGTDQPDSKLDVRGNTQIVDPASTPDTRSYATFGVTRPATSSDLSYIGLTRQGEVPWGIGISSSSRLIFGQASSPTQTIPNPRMVIDPFTGNVGIGTSGPSYRLDVIGDVRATGTYYGNADVWDGHHWGDTYPYSSNSDLWDGYHWGATYPYSSNSDLVDGIHGGQFLRNDQSGTLSGTLQVTENLGVGMAPDSRISAGNTTGTAGSFRNSSSTSVTMWVSNNGNGEAIACGNNAVNKENYVVHVIGYNNAASSKGLWVRGETKIEGNLLQSNGTKNAVVPTSKGMTKVYSQESPEVWFEDFGDGQLVNGEATINLESIFLETVTIDGKHPMKVFVTLNDDCNGVFVKTATSSFTVKELRNGKSSARFSYRVVAKRKGFEDERLAPVEWTADQEISHVMGQ